MAKKKAGNAAGLAALAGLAYMASQGKPDRDDADRYTGSRNRFSADTEDAEVGKAMGASPRALLSASSDGSAINQETGEKYYPGGTSGKRINQETGETYTLDNTAPAARVLSKPSAAPRTLTSSASGVGNPSENQPYRAPGGVGKRTGSGTIPVDIPVAQKSQAPKEAAPAASKSGFGGPIYYPPPQGQAEDANLDKEAYNKFLEKRPGIMQRMREKDRAAAGSTMKKGGAVKKMASGGMTSSVSSASRRADGIAVKGKTRGKMT
jgi:hypothetical protein